MFHRLVQSSIKSNRSKMRRDDDSNGIAIKLETRLDVDDITSSATPIKPRPHIYGCSRLVPAMDVNFYQIEDELMGIKWEVGGLDGNHPKWDDHQVGGHLPHSTAPVAKLLDQVSVKKLVSRISVKSVSSLFHAVLLCPGLRTYS